MAPELPQAEIRNDLSRAVEKTATGEPLRCFGDKLCAKYESPEYDPKLVLSVVADVYAKYRNEFKPKISFFEYVEAFGSGLIKLCQTKLSGVSVDGVLGQPTKDAFAAQIPDVSKWDKAPQSADLGDSATGIRSDSKAKISDGDKEAKPLPPLGVDVDELTEFTYKRGTEKGHVTNTVRQSVAVIYNSQEPTVTIPNLVPKFGEWKNFGAPFLITEYPPGKPITFLETNIEHGIHIALLPLLKAVEKEIMDHNLSYKPPGIIGRQPRNMSFQESQADGKLKSVESKTIPSFHAWGLAIDINKDQNRPEYGRGNIPDEVVMAFAKFGFLWGLHGNPGLPPYLGNDPMHFQLSFLPNTLEYLAMCQKSPVAMRYLRQIQPVLDQMRK